MTKREYAEVVASKVNGTVNEVEKTNGIVYIGVSIPNETNICPNIYIDQMYEEKWSVEKAVEEVQKINERYKGSMSFDPNEFMDYKNAKRGIKARLYNATTKASIYRDASEYGFEGLIIVPVYQVNENASIKINAEHIKSWGVTADEVIDLAMEQSKQDGYEIQSMISMMMKLMGVEQAEAELMGFEDDGRMYVLSNKNKMFGAIGTILLADELKKRFPSGYIVIPSSVHEAIIMPRDIADEGILNDLVNDVNRTEVAPEEVLGSKVYIF